MGHVLPDQAVDGIEAYRERGGGGALEHCHRAGPDAVIAEIRAAGLRGRGGAGFPTGIKWAGIAQDEAPVRFVVCNAAEGEPGTFKDRAIIRRDPYQVVEGLAVAGFVTGATAAFIAVKERFARESARLQRAAEDLSAAGLIDDLEIVFVPGPDDYLFGEEKGLLEVIEGRDPLPRLYPPYVVGLFEQPNGPKQPAVVNNVETLANVPHILARGSDWYRSVGTADSPGTMVFTVGGDVEREGVAELEMGTPLRHLIDSVGGGVPSGRGVKMVLNGVSNAPLTAGDLDVPMSFEGMSAARSGLGSGGFIVFDDATCATRIAAAASAFLYRGSCGQCPPCKLGTGAITEALLSLAMGRGRTSDLEEISAWTIRVTDANRCGLGAGQQAVARGILEHFPQDLAHHLDGHECESDRPVSVTTISDWDEERWSFTYAEPILEDAPGA